MKPIFEKKLYIKLLSIVTLLAVMIVFPFKVQAQQDEEKLQALIDKDRTTIDAIAGYDENVQQDILQLAQTPEVLNILEDLQKKSEKKFREIIQDYDRDGQSALYEMARYPDLISDLIRNGKPSSSEVNSIVSRYPSDIRETAKKYARSYYSALTSIDQLNNQIDQEFQSYLSPYDEETRASVKTLLKYPEIVTILVEDKEFTRLLGSTYREDSDWVINKLDTISKELEQENQKDLADYKNQIQKDPEAAHEMMDAAEKFAAESNMNRENEEDYPEGGNLQINVIHSYPYWYGYPYWYPYPYWRPYPVYYHTGFYIGPNRNLVFIGLPSFHFIYWQTHYHPTLYPHLSYNYYSFYHNHYLPYREVRNRPISYYGFYHGVERNVINNPRVNNDNLMRIDHSRGSNIVRKPYSNESFYSGRRSSTINRSYNSSSSVRHDAFPRTTPSTVSPSENSYRRSPRDYQNSGAGQSTAPAYERGARIENKPGGYLNSEKRNMMHQRVNSQDNSYRNYRNFRATESRQANPSLGRREPVQRVSINEGRQNNSQPNKTTGRFRESRERR